MIEKEKAISRLNRSPLLPGGFRVADISDLTHWEKYGHDASEGIYESAVCEMNDDIDSMGAIDIDADALDRLGLDLEDDGFYIAKIEEDFDRSIWIKEHNKCGDIYYFDGLGYWFMEACGCRPLLLRFQDTLEEARALLIESCSECGCHAEGCKLGIRRYPAPARSS